MARALAVWGTASHAGKSVVAAGLCRLFARRGVRVAPFKAQNMALNAAVTPDGLEIGRAQAFQARAAGLEPHVDMNPVLLKPTGEGTSQVVVMGRVVATLEAGAYHARAKEWRVAAGAAYDRLAARYDLIVIEGAGSPAEINLTDVDLANLWIASHAAARAILVADIDRGGVFASILGTLELLRPEDRARVAGVLINKFRGQRKILDPGLRMIRERTDVPVLGVVPWIENLAVEEEDSLGLEGRSRAARPGELDVAVVRLPRISNYTDFLRLEQEAGVCVRYVADPREVGTPALVVLPGTKNTLDDLRWLRRCGMADRILGAHKRGAAVLGICGGYQMLGRRVEDPEGVEGGGSEDGLGLLPVSTQFAQQKRTERVTVSGERSCGGPWAGVMGAGGYEIRMGRVTFLDGARSLFRLADGTPEGAGAWDRGVAGTSVHGLLDDDGSRAGLLSWLRARAGLSAPSGARPPSDPAPAFDRLADALEAAVGWNGWRDLAEIPPKE